MSFNVETDHKPLVSLTISKRSLIGLCPRIQRFQMRLLRYMYMIPHVPGMSLGTADGFVHKYDPAADEVSVRAIPVAGVLSVT